MPTKPSSKADSSVASSTQNAQAQTPLFSLIMPVYGAEKYIHDAVSALLSQSFGDFELILVDDASPDASIARAQEAAGDDPRVRLITNPVNLGASVARNRGLEVARGAYVAFPDADDITDATYLQLAAEAIQATGADLIVEGVIEDHYTSQGELDYSLTYVPNNAQLHTAQELALHVLPLEQLTLLGYPYNKFIKRAVVGSTRFDEQATLSEDFFFFMEVLPRIQSAVLIDQAAYHYARRESGNLTARFHRDYWEALSRRMELLQTFQEAAGLDTQESRGILGAMYARYLLSAIMQSQDPRAHKSLKERSQWLEQVFSSELAQKLLPQAQSSSPVTQVAAKVLSCRIVPLGLGLGRGAALVQKAAPSLFSKARYRR